jgi:hypothetical protein
MTPEELRDLLSQQEGLKLDFKREFHLDKTPPPGIDGQLWTKFVAGQRHEFIKDILALANGNVGTADQPGYLVIGAGDDKLIQPPDGRPLFDMRSLQISSPDLLQLINAACSPPLPDIQCENIELDGKILVVITIPPTPYVHETNQQLRPIVGSIVDLTGSLRLREKTPITERTAFVRRREGIFPATKDERRALEADKSPETLILSTEPLALDEFTIAEAERAKVNAIFFPPKKYKRLKDTLTKVGRLWIVGPSGIWKRYLATSLALDHQVLGDVYRIPRFVDWEQLSDADVNDCTLLFPDALGVLQYEVKKIESEFRSWEKLQIRGNFIIATSSEDVFADAAKETRLLEFIPKEAIVFLDADTFDYADKKEIFRRMVHYCHVEGIINERQRAWALQLIETKTVSSHARVSEARALSVAQMHRILNELWLPVDLERFIFDSLPTVGSEQELFDLLRRDADLDKRIHSWFVELNNSVRCFVLTLAFFSGFDDREIWARHQKIIERLRRLDPGLSIPPLGILRQLAQPYVTNHGPLEFVNPRIFQLVTKEIGRSFREYFVDLVDLLKDWSIPELPTSLDKDERNALIRGTEEVRNAIARVTGEVGRVDLDSTKALLETWAMHRMGRIGKTAGIALKEVAKDPSSAQGALELLNQWSADFSSTDTHNMRWASASALGRIAPMKLPFGTFQKALKILQRLATDQNDYVASAVPQAFRMMGSALRVEALGGILTRLAKRDKFTRQEVAAALDEGSIHNAESVLKLLDVWAASRSANVRWCAIFTLLTGRKISPDDKYKSLIKFLSIDGGQVIEVFREILADDDHEKKKTAQSALTYLAVRSPEARGQLINALVATYEQEPAQTQRLLDDIASDSPQTGRDIQFDVHATTPMTAIKTLLTEPTDQRAPFLARLLDEAPSQSVEAVRAELGADGLDWFLSRESVVVGSSEEFWPETPTIVARTGVQAIADKLCEEEQGEVNYLKQQISVARTMAAEVGIKDFSALDQSVAEIESLGTHGRYSDFLKAKDIAQTTLLTNLSVWEDLLAKRLSVKSAAIARLQAQRDTRGLTQNEMTQKANTGGWIITTATLILAALCAGGLLLMFISPTRNFTLSSPVKLNQVSYPSGSEFEVLEESQEEICLDVAENRHCYEPAGLLRFGEIKNNYPAGVLLRIPIILAVVLVLWILLSLALKRMYRDRLKNQQTTDLNLAIKRIEKEIRTLSKVKDHFSVTGSGSALRFCDSRGDVIRSQNPV